MTSKTSEMTSTAQRMAASQHVVPVTVPVPEVTPIEKLGDVLQMIQSDARQAPRNYLSELHAPYGGE